MKVHLEFAKETKIELFGLNAKSNQIVFVTCTKHHRCRPYSEMLTYEALTNNAVKNKYE
jgi:hypothetical protein